MSISLAAVPVIVLPTTPSMVTEAVAVLLISPLPSSTV